MILKSFNRGCRVSTELLSQLIFSNTGAPEIPNVGCVSLSHEIYARINCFLFCYKPLVHFKCTRVIPIIRVSSVRVRVLNLIDLY
jgi:hypothetical protein